MVKLEKVKHIFFVHSPITYIVATKVIEFKKLKPDQPVFLTHRGFRVPAAADRSYEFPYLISPEPFPFQLNFLQSRARIRRLDRFIDEISDKASFYLYLPHSGFRVLKLLASHPKCKAYFYIEEGLGSYYSRDVFNTAPWTKPVHPLDRIFNGNRIRDKFFYNSKVKAVYGLYKESFPDYANRVVLQDSPLLLPEKLTNEINKEKLNAYHDSHIIVLDAVSVYHTIKTEVHLYALLKLVKMLEQQHVTNAYIKFHPDQLKNQEYQLFKKALALFCNKLELIEIEQDTFLEYVAQYCSGVTFYVNMSSVGLYASKAGQKVMSWAPFIMEMDGMFQKKINQINSVFLKSVQLMEG